MSDAPEGAAAPVTPESVFDTVGYDGFVKALFQTKHDSSGGILHAVLGIITEAHEFLKAKDATNGLEEAGDLEFYEQAAALYAPVVSNDAVNERVYELVELCDEIGPQEVYDCERTELLDIHKRWIGYGKEPDRMGLAVRAIAFSQFVQMIGPEFGRFDDRYKVKLANVAKLLERYKGLVFSQDRAINRDVAAERSLLETHAA